MPPSVFADKNKDYEPPDDSDYPPIPTKISNAIKLMLNDVWGIQEPREYQVAAIFYMAFLKTRLMYLVRKTGEGKSLVLLGTASILRGVTLSSKWYRLLNGLAISGLISFVCIDEAHACVEQGESFRPEFKSSVNALKSLIATSKLNNPTLDIPVLAMSATFRIPEQRSFNAMMGDFPELVMWGDMNRRNVGIFASVAGEPLSRLINTWVQDVMKDPSMQSLIMSNSAAACDGRIIDRLEKAASKLPDSVKGEVTRLFMPFTGDSGLMLKMFLMACFCAEDSSNRLLVDIWCMPCTAAAHCGVSSKRNKQCYRYGPVPNMHDMIQEAGRVDRLHNAPPKTQCYNIFLNVTTFLLLWVRTQTDDNASIRNKNERQLFEVLRFIITPTKCYHEAIEEYFENPKTYQSRGPCIDNCSYCTKAHIEFTGRVSKPQLIAALQVHIFNNGAVSASKLVSLLTDKRRNFSLRMNVWGKGVDPGKVHGLILMLLATGMIELRVKSSKLVGTDDLKLGHVDVVMGKTTIVTDDDEI
eukprot:scaffold15544_cov108-Cyclotella_meneghiniana.AAC.1